VLAEAQQGPGRPPVEPDQKKVPFSASVRAMSVNQLEYAASKTGEQKGQLIERLANAEMARVMTLIYFARENFIKALIEWGFGPVHREENSIESGDQIASVIVAAPFTIHVTERALYQLGTDPDLFYPGLSSSLNNMRRFGTPLARMDFTGGLLEISTYESVQQSLEVLKNKRVRMWVIGENEPYFGTLTDFGEAVQLGALMGGPPERNGTGLIHKGNVLRVEQLEL
jgi:hypothetical protein